MTERIRIRRQTVAYTEVQLCRHGVPHKYECGDCRAEQERRIAEKQAICMRVDAGAGDESVVMLWDADMTRIVQTLVSGVQDEERLSLYREALRRIMEDEKAQGQIWEDDPDI